MASLWDLGKGANATITGLAQELNQEMVLRLEDMGFAIEQPVVCLQRSFLGGPVVVAVGDTVFSLERQIACSIFVKPQS